MGNERFTPAEILNRITVSSRGLGADLEDGNDNEMILVLSNGQRFTITVTEGR